MFVKNHSFENLASRVFNGNDIFAALLTNIGNLNSTKQNIFKFIGKRFFAVLLLLPLLANAQNDSITDYFQKQFLINVNALNQLYCFSDSEFYPGKFRFGKIENFKESYQKLNSPLFSETSELAANYFNFLNGLNTLQKQNFIRYFSFYEKDFETALKKAGLPIELKYLAPALSGLNRFANGFNQRAGIWQLTHFQAVLNGLTVSKMVDERLNEHLSTQAFTKVIKQNVPVFESNELAVLGYLFGNTKVKNAIAFAGENASTNKVLEYLPATANHYIAMFQATAVFLSVNRFKELADPLAKRIYPDTAKISRKLHFQPIAEVLGISEKELEFLNPQYHFFIVPGNERSFKLALPNNYRDDFVFLQDSILMATDSSLFELTTQVIEYPPAPNRQYLGEPVKNLEIEGKTKIKYRIKTGDVLGIIAEDFDVRVADLKYWNNISNERRIQAGKFLDIFVDDENAEYYASLGKSEKPTKKAEVTKSVITVKQFQQNSTLPIFEELKEQPKVEHIVRNGESPYTIAKKYDGVTPEKILEWNNISDARKIQIGQKLTIYLLK